jgi:hypothetical protein
LPLSNAVSVGGVTLPRGFFVSVSGEAIAREARTMSGARVVDHVAVKRTWTFEWDQMLGSELATLQTIGVMTSCTLVVYNEAGSSDSYTVIVRPMGSYKRVSTGQSAGWRYSGVKLVCEEV